VRTTWLPAPGASKGFQNRPLGPAGKPFVPLGAGVGWFCPAAGQGKAASGQQQGGHLAAVRRKRVRKAKSSRAKFKFPGGEGQRFHNHFPIQRGGKPGGFCTPWAVSKRPVNPSIVSPRSGCRLSSVFLW